MTNPAPGTPEETADLERRTLRLARADLAARLDRIDTLLAFIDDGTGPVADLDETTRPTGPYVDRVGTAAANDLRTRVKGANRLTLMATTQGYNDERDRDHAERLTLEALFDDPDLYATADRLAVDRVNWLNELSGGDQ